MFVVSNRHQIKGIYIFEILKRFELAVASVRMLEKAI